MRSNLIRAAISAFTFFAAAHAQAQFTGAYDISQMGHTVTLINRDRTFGNWEVTGRGFIDTTTTLGPGGPLRISSNAGGSFQSSLLLLGVVAVQGSRVDFDYDFMSSLSTFPGCANGSCTSNFFTFVSNTFVDAPFSSTIVFGTTAPGTITPSGHVSLDVAQGQYFGFGVGSSVTNLADSAVAQATISNFQVAAVPEPAEWALLVAGFAMIGGIARRRNSVRDRRQLR